MTSRAMRLLAVASVVLALPMAAQRAGTIEVGGFARYVNFDNTLPMGDDMDIGGRVGVYLEPALTLEVDLARSSQSSVTYTPDRKSTRLNSSHGYISYAVFCLKKK